MLKKFLSKLSLNLDQLNRKRQDQPESDETLFPKITNPDEFYVEKPVRVKRYKVLTAFVCLVFLVSLLLHSYIDAKLAALKNSVGGLVAIVHGYDRDVAEASSIEQKVNYYKQIRGSRALYGTKTKVLLETVKAPLEIVGLAMDQNEFSIGLTSADILAFSRLINYYLSTDLVTRIAITSADYNMQDRTYFVKLDGAFK